MRREVGLFAFVAAFTASLVGCGHSGGASSDSGTEDGLLRDYSKSGPSYQPVGMGASTAADSSEAPAATPITRNSLAGAYELAGDPANEPSAPIEPTAPSDSELERSMAAETGGAEQAAPAETPAAAVTSEAPAAEPEGATLAIKVAGKQTKKNRCSVKVGNRKLGQAPIAEAKLSAGTHRVHVTCKDKREYVDTVTLEPGEHEELALKPSDLKKRGGKRTARR